MSLHQVYKNSTEIWSYSEKILIVKLQVQSQVNLNIHIQILIGKDLDEHFNQTDLHHHPAPPHDMNDMNVKFVRIIWKLLPLWCW